jgi:hypothetical protein
MRRTLTQTIRARPLVSRAAVGGFALLVLLGWVGLAWLASERQEQAAQALPSALSLRFLQLGLAARPNDRALRLRLARKRLEVGQLEAARALVLPLAPSAEAHLLLLELDYARWCAVQPADRVRREARKAELLATLSSLADGPETAPLPRIAAMYLELEQPDKAAPLLDRLARSQPDDQALIARADASWLEAGQPLSAAALHTFLATRQASSEHALLALARAELAAAPQPLYALMHELRLRYPRDIPLLTRILAITESRAVDRARDLALELTRTLPDESTFHREAARLAEASGRSLCALDQYMWLWRHEHRPDDRARALQLARANWDLELVRELLDGARPLPRAASRARLRKGCGRSRRRPVAHEPPEWQERYQLYEALGDSASLRGLLAQIVQTPAGDNPAWWQRKLALERRLGDHSASLDSLTQMLKRFPGRGLREQLATLQLGMGDPRAALHTLLAAPNSERDVRRLRQLVELAAAVGDIETERQSYEALVREPEATLWDHQRLLALSPDVISAGRLAATACQRFDSFDMFYIALTLYKHRGDELAQFVLLKQVEPLEAITSHAAYWQLRIELQQAQAARAARAGKYSIAKGALQKAEDLLKLAAKRAPAKEQYTQLWAAQHAQALGVGLASGDKPLALRAFLATRSGLGARERVYLLIKLGQTDAAFAEAQRELERGRLTDSDRSVIENDALGLGRERATELRVDGQGLAMPGLRALGASGRADYDGLHIHVAYTQFLPTASELVHELALTGRGRLSRFTLELGASARDPGPVRPFGTLSVQLTGDEERGAMLQAHANVVSIDTAQLRLLGASDALVFKAAVGFGKHFWGSTRASAETYYTRAERRYLGSGATVDLGIGSAHPLPAQLGHAGVRVFGRAAPRFPEPESAWLPASSVWTGFAVSAGSGELEHPRLFSRQYSYALDLSMGLLWPNASLGWSTTVRLGVTVFGADLLSLAATAGNVLGASGFSGNLAYAMSFAN